MVLLVLREQEVHRVALVVREVMELQVQMGLLVLQVALEQMAFLVALVNQVHQGQVVHQVLLERAVALE
jgi:hypothetical protein